MLTTVSLLGNLDLPSEDIRMQDLCAGRLGPMFSGSTLWSRYPSLPSLGAFIHLRVMLLVGGLVTTAVYILRFRLHKPFGAVSIVALTLGAIPYAMGMLVLRCNVVDARACGAWLAVMVLGVLYAGLAAGVLATMELAGSRKGSLG
jgi:hypothetical protein